MAGTYKVLGIQAEPVLHPLLVHIFGRTCGHDASKIRSHSGLVDCVGFEQAMSKSIRWFEARRATR
jgi:hypothetical protein